MTIYVANAALNNRLIIVMKNVNALKRIGLLKMIMSIEIVVDREKTIEKKKQKKNEKDDENDKNNKKKSFDAIDMTRHWYISSRESIYRENFDKKMLWIELNLYQRYFKKNKTKSFEFLFNLNDNFQMIFFFHFYFVLLKSIKIFREKKLEKSARVCKMYYLCCFYFNFVSIWIRLK